jgi:hypothetical protein
LITFVVHNKQDIENSSNKTKSSQKNKTVSSGYSVNYNVSNSKVKVKDIPYWKSININDDGKIKISFSDKLFVPNNPSVSVNTSVLNVKLIS